MNYIKHLSGFFNKVSADDRLNPTHISLYVSLFQFWNACRFHNPISISRNEVMKVSKICSKATYHKCIRELNDYGYLSYQPSYNPFKGSLVYLFDFQASSKPVKNENRSKTETSSEQAMVSYTNSSNNNKQQTEVNDNAHEKNDSSKIGSSQSCDVKKEKSSAKKEKVSLSFGEESLSRAKSREKGEAKGQVRPLFEQVQNYFIEKKYPALEAEKFYYHYESNGWLIGKTPMQNWEAAAESWMIKAELFAWNIKLPPLGNLHTSKDKDYGEPL